MLHWILKLWEWLVEPRQIRETREYQLSRLLNIILLVLIIWGAVFEIQYRSSHGSPTITDVLVLATLVIFGLSYYINHRGHLVTAMILTLVLFVGSTFAATLIQYRKQEDDLSALYVLIIAILISEMYMSIKGYLITVGIILIGTFGISILHPEATTILLLLFVYSVLIGFSSYYHRSIQKEQITLAGRIKDEQYLRSIEQRRSAQLELLEETGRQISESLHEKEILQKSIDAVVNRFGYAETAISLLTNDSFLEVAAIAGTQDFGYRAGFKQELGKGIIGYTAKTQTTYITNDVSTDPYYFSNAVHTGSAIGVPILKDKGLLGVLYIESSKYEAFDKEDARTLETFANQISASLQRARLYSRSQEHLRVMSTLQTVSQVVSTTLDLEKIFESVVKVLQKAFGYTHVSIYLLKEDYLYLGAQVGYPHELAINQIHISQGVSGRAVQTKQAQFVQDVKSDHDFLRADHDVVSEICVPLLKEDMVLGTLNVEADAVRLLTQADVDLLITLAGPISLAVDNARLHAQVKELAMIDAVSGIANRRVFEEKLVAEVERSRRLNYPLSLIIFDLDTFKEYNDKWGHPAGDIRIRATADLIQNNLRKYDIAARYGGDEFAVILPNTDSSTALLIAKRLLATAQAGSAESPVDGKGISGYTLSMGIATFPQDADTHTTLLIAADHAELRAKQLGKNQIFIASDLEKI